MKILFINEVCGVTSTGRIVCELADKLSAQGHECKVAYGRLERVPENWKKYAVRIGSEWDVKLHALQTRTFDQCGFGSTGATKRFLEWAEQFEPDLVWLHNLHGYYINIEQLFLWIKRRPQMQVKWTLHDCWSFTGHCTHFSAIGCEQWKTGCKHCRQLREYPKCYGISNVTQNYDRKKAAFTGVQNMTIITPSQWLADLVGQSFLKEYPVEVHYNTVDASIFKPTQSDFRVRYGLQNKKIILGVANVWNDRKGLGDFVRLAEMVDENYVIVLVGLTKKQIEKLPDTILGIERTDSTRQLAEIYTAADIFVNPSLEETFGMTTVEALACGTTAIVYKGTACEEVVNKFGGVAVEKNVQALRQALEQMGDSIQEPLERPE